MIEINTKFKFFKENFIFIFLFFIISCQPIEILDKVIFENNKLAKINLNSKTKIINQIYEANFAEPYIDHSLEFSPSFRFKSWVESNINSFGNVNIIEINILNASITKKEIANENAKIYEEKYVFLYELIFSLIF